MPYCLDDQKAKVCRIWRIKHEMQDFENVFFKVWSRAGTSPLKEIGAAHLRKGTGSKSPQAALAVLYLNKALGSGARPLASLGSLSFIACSLHTSLLPSVLPVYLRDAHPTITSSTSALLFT